jgi:hypothetical protein
MAYSFFRRGSCVYWHEDPATLKRAHHRAATDEAQRGFSQPGPIETTDLHPSRLTDQGAAQAWRVDA